MNECMQGRVSLCSCEAGWIILGSVDLELETDPGMPPTVSSCQLLYMFSFLFLRLQRLRTGFERRMKTVDTRKGYKYPREGTCKKQQRI